MGGASAAFAFTPLVTGDGRVIRWPVQRKINLALQPNQQSGLTDGAVFGSVLRSIRRWQQATLGGLRFDLWMGTDSRFFVPANNYNGYSNIFFASQSTTGNPIQDPSLIAYTQVWYDPGSAEILETDMVLNDIQYHFTENAGDSTSQGMGRVFVDSIVTHEMGHVVGMSHSLSMQSTMFPIESRDQYRLACDDHAGALQQYPQQLGGSAGTLVGRVVAPSGASVLAAQVNAISRRRGVVLATATTDRNGMFVLGTLEPGEYFLQIAPVHTLGTGLPEYFQGYQHAFCSGTLFPRQFIQSGNRPQEWQVQAGQAQSVGNLSLSCNGPSTLTSVLSSGVLSHGENFAWVDSSFSGGTRTYRFENVVDRLEIRMLGFSLFSPVTFTAQLVGTGRVSTSPIYESESGYKNWDAVAVFDGLQPGNYTVQVSIGSLGTQWFPAGGSVWDSNHSWLVLGNVRSDQAPGPSLPQVYAFNPKCRAEDNLAPYASPGGDPQKTGNVGFCGTVSSGNASYGDIASWFAPWILTLSVMWMKRQRLRRAENAIN